MNIRKAAPSDVGAISNLFDQYRYFYGQPLDVSAARAFIDCRLKLNESVIFVAERNSQVIGFAQLYPSFSSVSLATIWILNDLFVEATCRGQGAATELINACVAFAKESGAKRITLQTGKENKSAQALYEKLKWIREDAYLTYDFEL